MDKDEKKRFEAAVQAEVEQRLTAQQAQFAQMMEQAMKAGLQGVDQANLGLDKERKALERAQDEARAELKRIEREAEKITEAYFEKSRSALIESAQKQLLRELTREHLEFGRAVEDICLWLNVKKEYVEGIIEIMDRRVDYRRELAKSKRIKLDQNPRLSYESAGRSGAIIFENNLTRFEMWWEFGIGDALLIIDIPSEHGWGSRTKLPLDQRKQVLQFIAEQVIEDQAPSSNGYEIGDSVLTILR